MNDISTGPSSSMPRVDAAGRSTEQPSLGTGIRRLLAVAMVVVGVVFSMLAAASSSSAYPVQSGSLTIAGGTLAPGGTVTVTGGGFAPGAAVSIYVYSSPTLLSNTRADATGSISATVTIPTDLAPGDHTLQAIGPAPGGGTTDLTMGFTVTSSGTGVGGLPMTGFPTFTVLGVAALAVLVGVAFLLTSRRRTKVSR